MSFSCSKPRSEAPPQEYFRIRALPHFGVQAHILLQSANGPCPLLAVYNILQLKGLLLQPSPGGGGEDWIDGYMSLGQVNQVLADYVLALGDRRRKRLADRRKHHTTRKQEQEGGGGGAAMPQEHILDEHEHHHGDDDIYVARAVEDALGALPSMANGLDINVRLSGGVEGYESTQQTQLVDICGIRLVHGWLISHTTQTNTQAPAVQEVEDADVAVAADVGSRTINEVLEALAISRSSDPLSRDVLRRLQDPGAVADWLDRTSSQLTPLGLSALRRGISERELVCLFRNNHFSVLTKYQGVLLSLVTDEGLSDSGMCWESLEDVKGALSCFFPAFIDPPPPSLPQHHLPHPTQHHGSTSPPPHSTTAPMGSSQQLMRPHRHPPAPGQRQILQAQVVSKFPHQSPQANTNNSLAQSQPIASHTAATCNDNTNTKKKVTKKNDGCSLQ